MSHEPDYINFIELPILSPGLLAPVKAFYSQVFGRSYQDWGKDYSDTTDSGIGSGLNADPAHQSHAPLPVLYTHDLERKRQEILTAGGVITREIFSFPGGRRFHFKDLAGNELALWSEV